VSTTSVSQSFVSAMDSTNQEGLGFAEWSSFRMTRRTHVVALQDHGGGAGLMTFRHLDEIDGSNGNSRWTGRCQDKQPGCGREGNLLDMERRPRRSDDFISADAHGLEPGPCIASRWSGPGHPPSYCPHRLE